VLEAGKAAFPRLLRLCIVFSPQEPAGMNKLILGAVAIVLMGSDSASGADLTIKAAAQPAYDWTGSYFGAHFGYGGGSLGSGTNPVLDQGVFLPPTITGLVGGYQAGWNLQLPDRLVVGVEGDVTFTSAIDRGATGLAPFNTKLDYIATARPRVGYAFGTLFPYVTAGLAWGETTVEINNKKGDVIATKSSTHVGWTAGLGVAFPVAGKWTGKVEYNHVDLGAAAWAGPTIDPKIHLLKVGLSYRIWDAPPWGAPGPAPAGQTSVAESSNFNIHGQTTFITQGYPSFHSPYEGQHSLPGKGQVRESWTATGYLGWRLWEGGELYFDPELDQGFGIGNSLGLAGFANGEAQKGGAEFPKFRAQRYFFRQTFGLGGERETVEDAPNQLPGKRDVDRVTITIGRIAVGDIFDTNAYAHDPRADFMNWALWASAAYDFPADLPGFTRGAVVELDRKDWALRAGVFQVPEEPGSDVLVFKTGGAVLELEERYTILDQAGKLRLGAFANRGRTGNYNEALAIAAANPAIDVNAAMLLTRAQRPKYGFYANLEQAIDKDVGVFARVSWNDGRNEILSFTDIDWSVSGGVSIKGNGWGRPDDRFGLGAAINGLSGPHRAFIAAGGLGPLIGDGKLDYREEKILEAYYAYKIDKWTTLTFDYQFFIDPAHNADRGPVSVLAARLHAEF
jgi:high affinity Mn2+ porin